MKKFLLIMTLFCLCSCEQYVTREFGGKTEIKLERGQRLVEATWKNADLWYLTEPMDSDYTPKRKVFKESSMYGVCEGEVIFIETQ